MKDNKELKWKTIHKTKFSNVVDFLEEILLQNGIKEQDIDAFLHPTTKLKNDPLLMSNMDKAIELLHYHIRNNHNILVRVDCDVDGYCSASMIIQFIKSVNPDIVVDYILNYEKQHGLTFDDMKNYTSNQYQLVIVPDASLTVQNAVDIKRNFKTDILVLDHHIIEKEYFDLSLKHWIQKNQIEDWTNIKEYCYTDFCLAVNCTDGSYPNPNLCGAGVVQKFIEGYVSKYSVEDRIDLDINYFLDLTSLAMIADSVDLRDLENRYYVIEGFKPYTYNNKFVNALVEKYKEDMKYGRYIVSMGWQIAPKINGCIRYGKPEEQDQMFRAILNSDETVMYQPRRKSRFDPIPDAIEQTIQEAMARICDNIKSRQDTEVRKFVKELESKIENEHLDKNSVIFVDGTNILEKGTTSGLVANKLASTYFRPVVLLRQKSSTEYGGSMRGYDKGVIDNTKDFLERAGVNVMGHENAAGVSIPKEKLEDIIKKCNEMLPIDSLTTVYTCDWEIDSRDLKREYVEEVASNYAIFGSTIPEPVFAITNIITTADKIQTFGENKSFIRFNVGDIQYSKKYCSNGEYDLLTLAERTGFGVNKKKLSINLIGQFTYNTYDDKLYPEVKIIAFESKELKEDANEEFDTKLTDKLIDDFEVFNIKEKTNDDDFEW